MFEKFPVLMICALSFACSSTGPKKLAPEDRAIALNEIAAASIQENDPTSALIALEESKQLDPKNASTHYLLALTYHKKNETELAIESARNALTIQPGFSDAKNTLGRLLMESGNMKESEKYLREAATDLKFRQAPLARTNLGILYYRQGKLDQSKAELTRALKDDPQGACIAAFYRGQVYLLENQLELARKDFDHSSKFACASYVPARFSLAKTLLKQGKTDLARTKFVELRNLYPDTPEADQATEILKGMQ